MPVSCIDGTSIDTCHFRFRRKTLSLKWIQLKIVVWYPHYFLLRLPSNRIYIKKWHYSKPWKCFQFNYFERITLIASPAIWRVKKSHTFILVAIVSYALLYALKLKLKWLMLHLLHHTLKFEVAPITNQANISVQEHYRFYSKTN